MKPLFLLSLPRSGSTLVQRVLAAHPRVATSSEPWLLLPQLYALRPEGTRAEYWHVTGAEALEDFAAELPGGRQEYRDAVRAFALRLYGSLAGDAEYFLDKTPRYALIAEELLELFPEARFVFLWRNPLSVIASLLETFRGGRFEPHHFAVDLYAGVSRLVHAAAGAGERGYAVRYEDLVTGGDQEWRTLFGALSLDFEPTVLERFTEIRLPGRYGDPTGTREHSSVSAGAVAKWKATMSTRFRREWCRRYLRWLGPGRMAAMGYDLGGVLSDLDAIDVSGIGVLDAAHLSASRIQRYRRERALRVPESPRPLGPAFPGAR